MHSHSLNHRTSVFYFCWGSSLLLYHSPILCATNLCIHIGYLEFQIFVHFSWTHLFHTSRGQSIMLASRSWQLRILALIIFMLLVGKQYLPSRRLGCTGICWGQPIFLHHLLAITRSLLAINPLSSSISIIFIPDPFFWVWSQVWNIMVRERIVVFEVTVTNRIFPSIFEQEILVLSIKV